MRRLAACLVLCLAFAAPVTAREGRITVIPPAKDAALRGSISAAPTPPPPEEDALLLPLPALTTSISSSGASGGQCRTACSQQYYFCLAGDDDACPQHWSRCVSGCRS